MFKAYYQSKPRKQTKDYEHGLTARIVNCDRCEYTVATVAGPCNIDALPEFENHVRMFVLAPDLALLARLASDPNYDRAALAEQAQAILQHIDRPSNFALQPAAHQPSLI